MVIGIGIGIGRCNKILDLGENSALSGMESL